MNRIVIDVSTGEQTVVPLTSDELADVQARTAAEQSAPARFIAAVQSHLDATAQSHGYDSIYTACTYADEPAVALFQAQGQALRAWRSLVWAHCHNVMAAVMAEQRAVPSITELIADLPALVMP
jgi:hypothetical protein